MASTETDTREERRGLVVRLTDGTELPLVMGPAGVKRLTGDERSEHSVRIDCANGIVPTLPRSTGSGSHHRVPTARLLDSLGVSYTITAAS